MIELEDLKRDYDFLVKVILLGEKSSGKTSYFTRLIHDSFTLV